MQRSRNEASDKTLAYSSSTALVAGHICVVKTTSSRTASERHDCPVYVWRTLCFFGIRTFGTSLHESVLALQLRMLTYSMTGACACVRRRQMPLQLLAGRAVSLPFHLCTWARFTKASRGWSNRQGAMTLRSRPQGAYSESQHRRAGHPKAVQRSDQDASTKTDGSTATGQVCMLGASVLYKLQHNAQCCVKGCCRLHRGLRVPVVFRFCSRMSTLLRQLTA